MTDLSTSEAQMTPREMIEAMTDPDARAWALSAIEEAVRQEREHIAEMLRKEFESLRFDGHHHLGLGDVRLTIGHQEEILEKVVATL
jgi:hypothetical protein